MQQFCILEPTALTSEWLATTATNVPQRHSCHDCHRVCNARASCGPLSVVQHWGPSSLQVEWAETPALTQMHSHHTNGLHPSAVFRRGFHQQRSACTACIGRWHGSNGSFGVNTRLCEAPVNQDCKFMSARQGTSLSRGIFNQDASRMGQGQCSEWRGGLGGGEGSKHVV
mmetsp:Transcript_134401/g.233198  ORF Transcript_134401/g.233198 Transcript_134401/m.233198 type:complete len:170 (-) Transcript_134401:7-516(-)